LALAMILDLGQNLDPFELVRVTAQYSNAVLVAVLPYISDVSQKLDLPVPHPVTAEHIIHFSIIPQREISVEIGIRDGWVFTFRRDHVDTIQSDHSYSVLQDPDEIPRFFGEVKMSKAEAIQLARDSLAKLGISLESVFAEQEPRVREPWKVGTNTVPHYYVIWPDPRGATSVDIEINGNARRLERIWLFNKSLVRPPPKVAVVASPVPNQPRWPTVNPEYARQLIPIMLRAIDEYGQKLSLSIPRPLTTNHVARCRVGENFGRPYCKLELTNGWRFLYEHSMVTAYYAPDNLFDSEQRQILVKEFVGKWNITEAQAVELIRRTLAKLNYPTNLIHMDFEPQVSKPAVAGIPRYMFRWDYAVEGESIVRSAVNAEVDADKGEVKSLYYGDMAFWNQRPPIDVPILLPATTQTNGAPANRGVRPEGVPKSPQRPFKLPQETKPQ
jgi:hypothetical protein